MVFLGTFSFAFGANIPLQQNRCNKKQHLLHLFVNFYIFAANED